jgi:hypothetical protein
MKPTKSLTHSLISIWLTACSSSGPVSTNIDLNFWKARERPQPSEFQSAKKALQEITDLNKPISGQKEVDQLLAHILKTHLAQREQLHGELSQFQQITLKPGLSYDLDFESYCVHAGTERPLDGDGAYLGPVEGSPKDWLPTILDRHSSLGISQKQTQTLVWGLLSGNKFDQLTIENQATLLKIFPDAPIRFGNSRVEGLIKNQARNLLLGSLSTQVLNSVEQLTELKEKFSRYQHSFEQLEAAFAPKNSRTTVVEPTWLETPEGYFIKLTTKGYSKVNVKIYAPESMKSGVVFRPSTFLVMPTNGQRLALSPVLTKSTEPSYANDLLRRFLKKYGNVKVNPSEADLILKHPIDANKIHKAMKDSFSLTQKNFPNSTAHNNSADAFRHYMWSGLSAHSIGSERAEQFLSAHEQDPNQDPKEKEMDLFNNAKGREKAIELKDSLNFQSELEKQALNALKAGELKVLRK